MTQSDFAQLHSLLLALDHSPYAEPATRYAAFFAQQLELPLRALHVLDSRIASSSGTINAVMGEMALTPPEFDTGVQEVLEKRGEALKVAAEARLRKLGVEAGLELKVGLPAFEVLDASGTDTLLVLGKQGESAEFSDAARLGGVAEWVVRRAEGAVLLVPERFTEPRRLLLGYDGSTGAEEALEVALLLAQRLRLQLVALSVHDDQAEAQAQLAVAEARAARAGLSLEAAARSGNPVEAILSAARAGDIIAIGAFGTGRLAEFFRGSITGQIIRGSRVPVLLHS